LPILLPQDLTPPPEGGQALWQLGAMLACVGGPFFILAASAPLFQHWFSASGHECADNPYFLYAVSNAGSMLALLSYPVLIEPSFSLLTQSLGWAYLYGGLLAFTVACACLVRKGLKPIPLSAKKGETTTLKTRLFWILLAFIPSSLMLGVTTMITTDIASA